MTPRIAAVVAQLRILLVEVILSEREKRSRVGFFLHSFLVGGLSFVEILERTREEFALSSLARPVKREDGGWVFCTRLEPFPFVPTTFTDQDIRNELRRSVFRLEHVCDGVKTPLSVTVERSLRRLAKRTGALDVGESADAS